MRGRPHRSWPQRLLLAFNCLLIVGLLGVAGALGYTWSKYSRLPRVEVGAVLSERTGSDEPQNFLVVGVDTAANLGADDPMRTEREQAGIGGLRSDTIMVLRIDPGEERARLLSLPRDLWVPLASGGEQRINQALQQGGPRELIDTIESYLAIPIHHYVQIDFAGFLGLVEAIGGVPVYFPYPARDVHSGLSIEKPGCVTLDPAGALAYVRARQYEYFEDGRWRTDPSGDLGRISRQQDFIRRALSQAVRKGLRNPVTLDRLLDAGLESVQVDELLSVEDLLDLGDRLRSFDPDELEMVSVPVTDDTVGGAAVVRLLDEEAQPILAQFRAAPSGEEVVAPAEVRVLVRNGSGRSGEAGQAAADLAAVGFGQAGGPANNDQLGAPRTIVQHRPGQEAAADLVARWLVAGADLVPVNAELGADVVVVTGLDYAGVAATPAPSVSTSTSPPAPGGQPATTSSTTTTSVVGEVPEQPAGVEC